MKALVYNTDFENNFKLVERKTPKILNPDDTIVKITLSSICTSDLHIINGKVPQAKNDIILGHEYVGVVVETGSNIHKLKAGDRVSANCETFCGKCYYCKRGYVNNCETGGWQTGCKIDGAQAEFIRVPYADNTLNKLPDNVSDKNALFVGDILASGYFAAKMCEIEPCDTVAVIGAGPVGLCSMICAKILGAKEIIAVDINENRLNTAKKENLANYFLNPEKCDIETQIKQITKNKGADKVIEAAGGINTFEMSWKIARANGIAAIVAMYEENQILPLPLMYGKNLTFKTGGVDAIYSDKLIELISTGKINTDFLITDTFKLSEIEKAYALFKTNKDSCLKIAIEHKD